MLRGRIQGSAAGMNNARAAWIQMNGTGYDNPSHQMARRGVRASSVPNPMPTISLPPRLSLSSPIDMGHVFDARKRRSDMLASNLSVNNVL